MQLQQPKKAVQQNSQLPLINIVFLMLIFFLLAGTIAPAYELDVAPPSAQQSPSDSPQGSTVYVSKEEKI